MTTVPKRLAIKFNLKQNPTFSAKDIVPIFQRWIQEHAVEGLLIDVTNYSHVQDGPGVILIADEGDYGYDLSEGQAGLRYTRKRFLPDNLQEALRLVFRLALTAAQRLEDEDALNGIEFDYASAEISFLDRQHYQNQPHTFEAVQGELIAFISELYDDGVTVARAYDDPREIFAIRYTVNNPIEISTLEARFSPSTIPVG
jgi:hypothetical protein